MEIKSYMPVKIIFSKDCILKNKNIFADTGRFPLIITGRTGAKKSGALDEVINTLEKSPYILYDRIEENPKISTAEDAAMMSKKFNCDYIIAIGGGSALDAATFPCPAALTAARSSRSKWCRPAPAGRAGGRRGCRR